jgi:hypothetical protein
VATSLRPLGVGEILDAGIKVVTRHWKPLAGTILILLGPVFVVYVLLLASIDKDLLGISASFSTSNTSATDSADFSATEIVGFGLTYVLLFVTFLLAFVACFKAVSDAWLGATPSISRSLRFALRKSFLVGLLGLIAGVLVCIGFVLCILPGIWLSVAWCLCLPALLFEGIGPIAALKRSSSLIKGRWWASLLVCVVGYLLVSIIGGVIQLVLEAIAKAVSDATVALAVAQVIGSSISSAVTYPYLAAVLTILYFDQRVRKEGFDLQLQAEGFGVTRDPDAPLPAPLIGDELYTPEQRAAAPYWPPPPGWTPPPPAGPAPAQWASSSGWSAPSAGDPLRQDDQPADPLPPREPGSDEPAPTYPRWSTPTPPGDGQRDEDDKPQYPSWSRPQPPEDEKRDDDDKPDRNRADWLPPEPPRGPGGL